MKKEELEGIATVVGTIIGAGMLALPYVLYHSGTVLFLASIALGFFASFLITAYVAELSYSQKKIYQLPSLISKFLGKKYKDVVLILEELTILGALTAYFIGISSVLPVYKIITVVVLAAISIGISYGNFMALEKSETYVLFIKLAFILIISALVFTIPKQFSIFNPKYTFLAIGTSIFAFTSYTVVPEVREEIKSSKSFSKVLLISYVISLIIYLFFSFSFYGYFGSNIKQVATEGLKGYLYIIGVIFSVFLLLTPIMTLSLVFADVLTLDFRVNRKISSSLSGILPALLSISYSGFAFVLSIIGGVFLSLLSILVILALIKEKKIGRSEYKSPFGIIGAIFSLILFIIVLIISIYEI